MKKLRHAYTKCTPKTIAKSLAFLLILAPAYSNALTLTVGDKTYSNVTLVKEFPLSLQIRHAGGSAFLTRSDLSDEQLADLRSSSTSADTATSSRAAPETIAKQNQEPMGAAAPVQPAPAPSKAPLREGIEIDGSSMIVTKSTGRVVSRTAATLDDSGNVALSEWANDLNLSLMRVPRSQAAVLSSHLRKFLEWEDQSAKAGLKNISKQIGEVGDYDVVFERENTGVCKIVRKDDPDTDSLFNMESVLYLISMLDNLEEIDKAVATKEAERNAMQRKADDVLR